MGDVLKILPQSFVAFIDETGSEDYGDPTFPVFGYGGCAVMGSMYKKTLAKPWRQLKRERLGGANKPFHTTDFQKSKPTIAQITGINRFVKNPFYRFAGITSIDTERPNDMDGHKAAATALVLHIKKLVGRNEAEAVDLVFEDTERNKELVERDFNPNYLDAQNFKNISGRGVSFNCYFLSKASNTPGLEVADLIVHTAGRQERFRRSPVIQGRNFQPDFVEVFQRVDRSLHEYISVEGIKKEGSGTV